jgi:hypothetical protein
MTETQARDQLRVTLAVAAIAGVLAAFLAWCSYDQRDRGRTLSHSAISLSVITVLLAIVRFWLGLRW